MRGGGGRGAYGGGGGDKAQYLMDPIKACNPCNPCCAAWQSIHVVLVTLVHDHVALPRNMFIGNIQNMTNIHTVYLYIIIRLHSQYPYLKHCSYL
jgi:hypothetical protein